MRSDALYRELDEQHELQGNSASWKWPLRCAGDSAIHASFPVQGDLRCPMETCSSPTPAIIPLAELDRDGETLLRRIGTGERGLVNGPASTARVQ